MNDNPMVTDGFEFIEFAAPDPAALDRMFRTLGFTPIARHRSKEVTLYRQGEINFVLNAEPESFAQSFARVHGPSICAIAWRVKDAAEQAAVQAVVAGSGLSPTPIIDRFWFKSVYFQEPGGVLFELATDGPGFARDEDPAHLGEQLILPPWLEPHRAAIERGLPALSLPDLPVA